MGGMGFIHSAECEIMFNSGLINTYMPRCSAEAGVKRYFFSSSACVYRNMEKDEAELSEEQAYPALPDNEYGWEKLYAERVAMAYGRRYGMDVRLARLQNCYGPEGTWRGGREKAPAALCRKIAEAGDGDSIEVWGDGSAMRAFTYATSRWLRFRPASPAGTESPGFRWKPATDRAPARAKNAVRSSLNAA